MHFVEKPGTGNGCSGIAIAAAGVVRGRLANAGVYVLSRRIMDYIPRGFSDFGKDVFPALVEEDAAVYGYVFSEPPVTVDTVELYEKELAAGNQ